MARFDVGLEATPTTTIGRGPAIIDTSALAVSQIAEAFAKQFVSEKFRQQESQKKDATSAALSGLQTDILKVGQAVESGEMNLSRGNIVTRQRLIEFITQNPSLSKEAGELYSATTKNAGLTAGKSEAQLRQEQFLSSRKDLADAGWVRQDASPDEVSKQLDKFQQNNRALKELQDAQRQLTFTAGREDLDASRKKAINEETKQVAKQSIRSLVNAQHSRVLAQVNQWNKELSDGNRQQIFEQADALKREILAGIPSVPQTFLSREEVDSMIGVILSPIDVLKERSEKNMSAKWAQDRIDTTTTIAREDALQNPGMLKLHTFSKLVGEATLSRLSTNVIYQDYMSNLINDKGGKGTSDVPKQVLSDVKDTVISAANSKQLLSEEQERVNTDMGSLISGVLKDAVTDSAQGNIQKPSDINHIMDMLSDPAVASKIVNGEVVLDDRARVKASNVVSAEYVSKLVPTTKKVLSEPVPSGIPSIEGKSMGELYSLEVDLKSGALVATLKPEAIEAHAQSLSKELPDVSIETHRRVASNVLSNFSKSKDLKNLVTNINRSAKVMATLNREENPSSVIDSLVVGLLGGNPVEEVPKSNADTEALINTLPDEAKERFNSLEPDVQEELKQLSPDQIRGMVSLMAPK